MEWENQSVVPLKELKEISKQLISEDKTWHKGKSYIDGINDLIFAVVQKK